VRNEELDKLDAESRTLHWEDPTSTNGSSRGSGPTASRPAGRRRRTRGSTWNKDFDPAFGRTA